MQLASIDWQNLPQVEAFARELCAKGFGQIVVKYPDRPNYNITFASREKDLPKGVKVVYRVRQAQVCAVGSL